MSNDTVLWMVVRSDDHGASRIMEENLTQIAAMNVVLQYTQKGHKQLYRALSYTAATRDALIKKERILI